MRVSAAPLDESERGTLKRLYQDRERSCSPQSKLPKQDDSHRVLLYIRTSAEQVFDALLLSTPTLGGLREALSQKYGMQADTIGKIFKKCKRGIFINMDDTIVEHYTNQSAFLVEMSEAAGLVQLTLVEV
uniref:GRHL1/CP2 C-terminal domain-containing protein n=1 Tax=Neogobius melanostomus TaxID=47308 RepID=A0A8C6UJU4_9GOBI